MENPGFQVRADEDGNMQLSNIALSDDGLAVRILDQSRLPNHLVYLDCTTAEACYDAIRWLKVRGAPAIGIFAGYAMLVLMRSVQSPDPEHFARAFRRWKEYLGSSRPTAVNLKWALDRMERVLLQNSGRTVQELMGLLEQEAVRIHREDIAMCTAVSEYGLTLLRDGDGILTHCNAGPLATSRYGTAIGPVLMGTERGMRFHVYADETRPLLQGARLTAFELHRAGVDVTLICDNMASMVMKSGRVQACMVGADRIAANGDTANKIGTSGVAVLAAYYGIPFYVLAPSSTIDRNCPDGSSIPIEFRDPEEIRSKYYLEPMAPEGVSCFNPAFDVTDHALITGIVTEKGILKPPFSESISMLFGQET